MKDPSPSLLLTTADGAELWVSGLFTGFWKWQRTRKIRLRVNCLKEAKKDSIEQHLNMDTMEGLLDRITLAIQEVFLFVVLNMNKE